MAICLGTQSSRPKWLEHLSRDPRTYNMAMKYLGLRPHEVMMVACHKYDLHAAKQLGMRTAFVARPLEFGPAGKVDTAFEAAFDVNASDFLHLAQQLDC
ncbi:HAD hydrolase-like protein [Paraburkholderia sediminicola]|uniref:HAD hydrolase-like protein n=2 Tax=Paraburkholderia sediminicola TaxID=458836 RepID=UPI0038BB456C